MAEALVLDSEAVNALAHATERAVLAERSRAILQVAHERRALVRVPAPVLAEVCRGSRFDAAIDLEAALGPVSKSSFAKARRAWPKR